MLIQDMKQVFFIQFNFNDKQNFLLQIKNPNFYSRTCLPKFVNDKLCEIVNFIKLNQLTYAITSDIWSLPSCNVSLLSMTIHFFDDKMNNINTAIAALPFAEKNHTALNIKLSWSKKLEELNLPDELLIGITRDGAANISLACSYMNKYNIHCLAHVIHLVITNNLQKGFLGELISKCNKIVKQTKMSGVVANELINQQQKLDLPTNKLKKSIPTRWNSAYLSLKSVLDNLDAIQNMNSVDFDLSRRDENMLKELINFLAKFHEVTNEVSVLC